MYRILIFLLVGPITATAVPPEKIEENRIEEKRPVDALPAQLAAKWRECEAGEPWACAALGEAFVKGEDVPEDLARAAKYFRLSCDSSDTAGGSTGLGLGMLGGKAKPGDATQREVIASGSAVGCLKLGVQYELGEGVPQDFVKAVRFFTRACNRQNATACTALGLSYSGGRGIEKNETMAVAFLEKGCDGAEAMGCFALAECFEQGLGVEKDLGKAAALYGKACDWGMPDGCYGLAWQYFKGDGVEKDEKKAEQYFEKGCNGGHESACYNLACIHARTGRSESALTILESVIENHPEYREEAAADEDFKSLHALDHWKKLMKQAH